MTKRIMKYNPAFLTEQELVDSFVVRHREMQDIVEVIRRNDNQSNHHVLIIGPRGIGKTMFVLRVIADIKRDPELSKRWFPIPFAEESYNVTTPGEFWLEALDHLQKITNHPRWKTTFEELRREKDETRLRERALAQLKDFADEQGKRLLLVVENLNMIMAQISDKDAWTIRHTLQNEPRLMLLGSATSRFEEIDNIHKAMFELFKTIDLKPLSPTESRTLWTSITGQELTERQARPIKYLTGGSPRLISIIAIFGSDLRFCDLMENLVKLVDDHTDYFKGHLDNFAVNERKVYVALAEIWDPTPARKIAEVARQSVNATSSMLKRMTERGIVEVVEKRGKAQYYQITERMYNIYYQMRNSSSAANRVKPLVHFIVSFYAPEELKNTVKSIAEEALGLEVERRRDHFALMEEVLKAVASEDAFFELLQELPNELVSVRDMPEFLESLVLGKIIYFEGSPSIYFLNKILTLLSNSKTNEEGKKLLRYEYEKNPENMDLKLIVAIVIYEDEGKINEAEGVYREILKVNPENYGVWALLGNLLQMRFNRYEEAAEAYAKTISFKSNIFIMHRLGTLYYEKLGRFQEAAQIFRKIINLEPNNNAIAYRRLAYILHYELNQFDEAKVFYNKALEIDPASEWTWLNLGKLLHEKLLKFQEAEIIYKRAIEKFPNSVALWLHLGLLLGGAINNYEEAENAFLNSIKINPNFANGWFALSVIQSEELNKHDDAIKSLRKGLSIDASFTLAWEYLAFLLITQGKFSEALDPAQKSISNREIVKEYTDNTITLFIDLAAAGGGREALEILKESPSADLLEPLIVGIELDLGTDVLIATEILEIGKDVKQRIEERRVEMNRLRYKESSLEGK